VRSTRFILHPNFPLVVFPSLCARLFCRKVRRDPTMRLSPFTTLILLRISPRLSPSVCAQSSAENAVELVLSQTSRELTRRSFSDSDWSLHTYLLAPSCRFGPYFSLSPTSRALDNHDISA
jgi:hypothetical protein